MRSICLAVNQRDPSGMRTTEDRRAAELAKSLDAAVRRVLDKVDADSPPAEVQAAVDRELDGFTDDAKKQVLKWVQDTQKRSVLRAKAVLKDSGIAPGAILGPGLPLPQDVKDALAISVEQEIDSLGADAKKKLTRSLLEGIEAGEGARELSKRVAEDMAMPRQRAELIARTETMRSFNRSAVEAYKKAEVSRVMWYAAMDSRSCDQCGDLHLKVYPIEKAPSLPIHPRCRCTWLPVGSEEDA